MKNIIIYGLISFFILMGFSLIIHGQSKVTFDNRILIIQVCRPDVTLSDNNGGVVFSEALARQGVGSFGGGFVNPIGNTDLKQLVYEIEGHHVSETLGLEIVIAPFPNSREGRIHYWFKPPAEIPNDNFTNWNEAISQETAENQGGFFTYQKILRGQEFTKYPVDYKVAPKMRFKLINVKDYKPTKTLSAQALPKC